MLGIIIPLLAVRPALRPRSQVAMESPHQLASLLAELRRRKVTRVGITYLAAAFAGLQGLELVLSPLGAERLYRWIVIVTLAAFPVALVLAWFFELRQERGAQVPRATETGRDRPPRWIWTRRRAIAMGVLLLAGIGLLGYRMLGPRRALPAAAEVIAVAPFTAVGGETSSLGEGMAQLVAADLDQVGGLRTLDPTRVVRAWGEGGVSRRSQDEALALARKLGAGSVLISSAVAAGADVRLTSVLRATSGREIARAQVTGRAGDVLLLADSLSNRLLRAIWRARTPIPQLRIAAITTNNLEAIRAYLDGERYYRQLRWDSAVAALRRAVELDSTFALAHRRLADAYWWSGDIDSPARLREESAAARAPERLPERERAIAVAYLLFHQKGDYRGALDSLASHLRRYPDDAEALDLRAEVLVHGPEKGAPFVDDSTVLAAFDAALRVDPELTPAMLHPINLSARLGDSVRFRRYATGVLRAQLHDSARASILVDSAIGLLWQREPGYARFARRMVTDRALYWTMGQTGAPLRTLIFTGRDPNPAADAILTIDPEALVPLSLATTSAVLFAVGRLGEADRLLRALGRRDPMMAWQLRATAVGFGLAGRGFMPEVWPTPAMPLPPGTDAIWAAPVQALFEISLGDTTAAARALAAAASASGRLPPGVEALRRLGAGRLRAMRGDARGGVAEMESALRAVEKAPRSPIGPPPMFYRVLLAMGHAQYAPTRKRGIEELRRLPQEPPLVPLIRIYLGRALEAEGQLEAAKAEYAVFARQTGRAEGRMAQMHAEAQAALVRLTREQ